MSVPPADAALPRAGTILIADDEPAIAQILERLLVQQGYVVLTANDGDEALELAAAVRPDLVLSDVRMPTLTGFDVCRQLKSDPETRLTPVVLMTGAAEREDRIRAIDAGADDFLSKPVDEPELVARVRSLIRLKRHTDDLDSAEAVIMSLAQTIEARDPYTDGHCQRLARYACALGRRLGLEDDDLLALERGGVIHDIGKIAIPDSILLKPAALTADEFERMKQHPVVGDRLCGNLRALHRVRPIVRWHHERLDGTGYPDRLRGDAIPLLAQITAIADLYDAVTTARPYRAERSPEAGYQEMSDEVAKGWKRRDLVEAFIAAGRAGEFQLDSPA